MDFMDIMNDSRLRKKTVLKLITERGQLVDVLKEILDAQAIGFGASSAASAAALQRARQLLKDIDV